MEVTIGGDQSVDRNGSAGGRRSAHLNMDQSDGFEHPSRRGFEEGGVVIEEGQGVRNNTHCVLYFHAVRSLTVLCQVNSLQSLYKFTCD